MFLCLRVVLVVIAALGVLAVCVLLSPWVASAPPEAVCSEADARRFLVSLAAACAAGFDRADANRLVDGATRDRQGRKRGRLQFHDFEEFTLPGREPVTVRLYVQQADDETFEVSYLCWDDKVRGDLETVIERVKPKTCRPGERADFVEDWLWPMLRGGRWLVGGLLLLFFGYAAVLNLAAHLKGRSWAPLVGGPAGVIGLLCLPCEGTLTWAWVPLLLDWGSLPGMAYLLRGRA